MSLEVSLSFKPSFELHQLRKKNTDHIGRWLIEEIPCSNREKYRAAVLHSGLHIGEVHLRNFEREVSPRECLISYWIDEAHLNQGFATEAVRLATEYALEKLDVDIVVAYIHELNYPSISTAKKIGFSLKGTQKIPMYQDGSVETHLKYVYGNL